MNWGTTYIIGGGPSAGGLDTTLLTGGVRLGVNDASFHKTCDAFFSLDHSYAIDIRKQIEAFPGERHLAVRSKYFWRFQGWKAKIWRRMDEPQPSLYPGQIATGEAGSAGCSGHAALNLAAQKGARRIVLFGYDFHADYRYFFTDEPHNRIRIPDVLESFRAVAPWYAAHGIAIVNANPDSAIDAFPKICWRGQE